MTCEDSTKLDHGTNKQIAKTKWTVNSTLYPNLINVLVNQTEAITQGRNVKDSPNEFYSRIIGDAQTNSGHGPFNNENVEV